MTIDAATLERAVRDVGLNVDDLGVSGAAFLAGVNRELDKLGVVESPARITSGERWSLTTRTLPKEWGQRVQEIVAPLGELAINGTPERLMFFGYILDESNPRPVLIWSTSREPFRFEGEFAE